MKILYLGCEHDHYDRTRAKSFEHNNFYLQLSALYDVVYLPFDEIVEIGREKFNQKVLEMVKSEKPDVMFVFAYKYELEFETLDEIKKIIPTIGWFADDHWRLENYSRFYAPHFSWGVTTWSKAAEEYARYGITNIIRSQWACNTAFYKPVEAPLDLDVSFVGMKTTLREKIVDEIRRSGITVQTAGAGWGSGQIPFNELIAMFSRSRINLNLNPSTSTFDTKSLAQIFFERTGSKINFDFHPFRNFRMLRRKAIPQIKARPFEIAGCGGFCISGRADDIENYYTPDKEMVFYDDVPDLVEKIRYYLAHDAERQKIARAGYERTMRENTYQTRFEEIFRKIGLSE